MTTVSFEQIVFVQLLRTPHSEIWLADLSRSQKEAFAQIDIHYLAHGVEATVVLFKPFKSDEHLHKFLDIIDAELISIADMDRGNLRFRVIYGGVNNAHVFERPDSSGEAISGQLAEGD